MNQPNKRISKRGASRVWLLIRASLEGWRLVVDGDGVIRQIRALLQAHHASGVGGRPALAIPL